MRLLFIGLLALIPFEVSFGLSYETYNGSCARGLASLLDDSSGDNAALPQSWEDLDSIMLQVFDNQYRTIAPTKRYRFFQADVELVNPRTATKQELSIVMMMGAPFREVRRQLGFFGISTTLRDPGRYVIFKGPSADRLQSMYVYEDRLADAFVKAGIELPISESLGAQPHEVAYRRAQMIRWLSLAMALGALSYGVYRWLLRRGVIVKYEVGRPETAANNLLL